MVLLNTGMFYKIPESSIRLQNVLEGSKELYKVLKIAKRRT
jgi:hypothetical protein